MSGVSRRRRCYALANVDPEVVHEKSSFPFSDALRSQGLLSCYLTLLSSGVNPAIGCLIYEGRLVTWTGLMQLSDATRPYTEQPIALRVCRHLYQKTNRPFG